MKLALVEWLDSYSCFGWHQPTHEKPAKCITVGILREQDAESITISQSRSDSGNVCDEITIPRCSIKRLRNLKVVIKENGSTVE